MACLLGTGIRLCVRPMEAEEIVEEADRFWGRKTAVQVRATHIDVARFGLGLEQLDGSYFESVPLDGTSDVDAEVIGFFGGLQLGEDLLIAGGIELQIVIIAGEDAEAAGCTLEGAVAGVAVRVGGDAAGAVSVHDGDVFEGLSTGGQSQQGDQSEANQVFHGFLHKSWIVVGVYEAISSGECAGV